MFYAKKMLIFHVIKQPFFSFIGVFAKCQRHFPLPPILLWKVKRTIIILSTCNVTGCYACRKASRKAKASRFPRDFVLNAFSPFLLDFKKMAASLS